MVRVARRDRPAITCASVRRRAPASRCRASRAGPADAGPAGDAAPRDHARRGPPPRGARRTHHRPPGPARLARCVTPGCSVTACRATEWDPAARQVQAVRAVVPCHPGIRPTRPRPARPMVRVTAQGRSLGQAQVKDSVQGPVPGRGPGRGHAGRRPGTARARSGYPAAGGRRPGAPHPEPSEPSGHSTAGTRRSSARPTARSAQRGGRFRPAGRSRRSGPHAGGGARRRVRLPRHRGPAR